MNLNSDFFRHKDETQTANQVYIYFLITFSNKRCEYINWHGCVIKLD